MAEEQNGQEGDGGHTPPYTSFQSIKTLLSAFKANGIPGRIDRTVLTNFSGAVGGQILTALRFLNLIDEAGQPLPELRILVNAYGTDDWTAKLQRLLRMAYAPVFSLNLETASPGQFNEQFRKAFPAKDETLRKCITFFLNAAREAEIPISPYILKNKKPRSGSPARRKPRPAGGTNDGHAKPPAGSAPPPPPPAEGPSLKEQLLKKFPEFDPKWPAEIQKQWFDGFQRLMDSVEGDSKSGYQK